MGVANYTKLLKTDHILRNVENSLIVAVATAAVTAIVATLAGYGFGRFRFRGSGTIFGLVLLGFMVPFQAVIVPLFLELKTFHLLNTLPGLVAVLYRVQPPLRDLPDAQLVPGNPERAHSTRPRSTALRL